jgi:hypothetical protein
LSSSTAIRSRLPNPPYVFSLLRSQPPHAKTREIYIWSTLSNHATIFKLEVSPEGKVSDVTMRVVNYIMIYQDALYIHSRTNACETVICSRIMRSSMDPDRLYVKDCDALILIAFMFVLHWSRLTLRRVQKKRPKGRCRSSSKLAQGRLLRWELTVLTSSMKSSRIWHHIYRRM